MKLDQHIRREFPEKPESGLIWGDILTKEWIIHALEIVRWVGVIIGIQLAFLLGGTPEEQFHILMPWVVISLAGFTGIESLFFGKTATRSTGYAPNRAYQRQSGMNNIAIAVTGLLVLLLGWGLYAEVTVMSTLLTFLFLSACNHAYSAAKEGNRGTKNLLRPVMTAVLIAFVIPMMVRALV